MKLNTKSLSDVELGYPIFAEADIFVKLEKVEVKPTKDGKSNQLCLSLKVLNESLVQEDGVDYENKRGLTYTHRIFLSPENTRDPEVAEEMMLKKLKELAIAVGQGANEDIDSNDLVGKNVKARMVVTPAEGKYAKKNEFAHFYPITDEDGFNGLNI